MTEIFSIAVVVGSLRSASFSRKTAKALIDLAPPSLKCAIVEIGDLPLYNEDLDDNPPKSWTDFRSAIAKNDAILFVTPEYNRSVPGCLKNAIDVGSRPQGKSVFDGMPTAVVSVTPYKLGAFGANHALRQAFVFLNMPAMQQPEAYLSSVADKFDANNALFDPEMRALLAKFTTAFSDWVSVIRSVKSEASGTSGD